MRKKILLTTCMLTMVLFTGCGKKEVQENIPVITETVVEEFTFENLIDSEENGISVAEEEQEEILSEITNMLSDSKYHKEIVKTEDFVLTMCLPEAFSVQEVDQQLDDTCIFCCSDEKYTYCISSLSKEQLEDAKKNPYYTTITDENITKNNFEEVKKQLSLIFPDSLIVLEQNLKQNLCQKN